MIYKYILRIKIKIKYLDLFKLNYLIFIKKYLPGLLIVSIIIITSTHNILAKNYTTEEYANQTLLSNLITNQEFELSELITESAPSKNQNNISNYLEEQGNLRELVIVTPFVESKDRTSDILPDASSLVLNTPEDSMTEGTPTPSGDRTDTVEYIVQSGDVLGKIAEQFNVTVNTILWANNLNWSSTIKPGQKLTILPNSGVNHEVKSGDTILAIAKKYQADAEKIVSANKLADASDITIGDLLFIPDGVKTTPVVSSYKPKVYVPTTPAVDTGTKLLWPVISSRITQYYHLGHYGVDIGDSTGNPIYAAEGGRVERSGWNSGYGYNVVINHGNGLKTLYAHASKLLVGAGDSISRGQTIALVGSTGWSTGPHLHFEVIVNDAKQNPLNYIK